MLREYQNIGGEENNLAVLFINPHYLYYIVKEEYYISLLPSTITNKSDLSNKLTIYYDRH